MIGWIVAGVVVLAVAVLWSAVVSVAARLRPLARARRRLVLQGERARRLQVALEALGQRAAVLSGTVERISRRARRLRLHRRMPPRYDRP